ncbi:lysozyme inhibitor LprI family protein [Paraburkholderia sp.]|uniref:lysozyme inhibitor LprI family protein n=1 Tax=Paraburkholderia sp. TaxID=1926495 RepID=UPI002D6AC14C|nr:lysozyme inhibitor LprI family protein [Paraburkholderia sp.]HZZ04802.1 lysozyme inhibitor LprI family protein [Paraburkholderia sp.]
MKRASILAVSCLWLSIHAHAETIDCKNASDQYSLNHCADLDYQSADKKLNETYSKLLKKVSPQGKPRLQKAERAWVAYRDAQCEFLTSSPTPYSAQPMIHAYCLSRLTEAQTKLLDEQLHCAEGDIGCGQQ